MSARHPEKFTHPVTIDSLSRSSGMLCTKPENGQKPEFLLLNVSCAARTEKVKINFPRNGAAVNCPLFFTSRVSFCKSNLYSSGPNLAHRPSNARVKRERERERASFYSFPVVSADSSSRDAAAVMQKVLSHPP
jgi:hypothetical protein